jgi:hypothetical protein
VKTTDQIRADVEAFYSQHAPQGAIPDAFVPWWLTRKFGISAQEAIAKAPGGSHDYGLDGFHIEADADPPVLHLIQGKYSPSPTFVKKAFVEFGRTMPLVRQMLSGEETAIPQANSVLVRLAAHIQKHQDIAPKLRLFFEVIHLCDDAEDVMNHALVAAFDKFEEMVQYHLPDHASSPLAIYPPHVLSAIKVIPPTLKHSIRFEGVPLSAGDGLAYYVGFGYLADLVGLYETYDYALFAKNVRSFLLRKASKGPAKYIHESLKRTCIPSPQWSSPDPGVFAVLHNGVTLHAKDAELNGGAITLRQPGVLNGCQTVKTAYLFLHSPFLKDRIDKTRWDQIRVPLRVVVSTDDKFVTEVAVGNNRQTELRPSAFRANEPVQLLLAARLEKEHIYYERQEEAFENLRQSDAQLVEEKYGKSFNKPLKIEELAQVIAAASDKPSLREAARVSELFDDPHYQRVFNDSKLADLQLLIFLRNLFIVTPLVLKDLKDQSQKLKELPIGQFRYPAFRFLARYIWKHEPALIDTYSDEIIAGFGTSHPLRIDVRKLCAWQNSGLQQILPDVWSDAERLGKWLPAVDPDCISKALKLKKLHEVDVFQPRAMSKSV